MKITPALLIISFLFPHAVLAETLYVSDELQVAMRSGDTTAHRIIKFIKSGTPLEVIDSNDDDSFKLVKIPGGKQGWVEAKNLSSQPAAREQIAGLSRKVDSLRKNLGEREAEIKQLKQSLREAESKNQKLEQTSKNKIDELADLQRIASRPVQLAREKQQLEIELGNAEQERDRALAENEQLADDSIKEWFMIGAGVTLVSLFIGLIIPSIRWRKKDSWSSGGF